MELTLDQATRMVEVCPKGSHYYQEAMKVVEAYGQGRRVKLSLQDYEPLNEEQ